MLNDDNVELLQLTRPARLDKAMHTLEGIVRGIVSDGRVTDSEMKTLTDEMLE